jgi:hypothetical protein
MRRSIQSFETDACFVDVREPLAFGRAATPSGIAAA